MHSFLRVDCDYGPDGLWTARGSSIAVESVPISLKLAARLIAWQAWHDVAARPWENDDSYDWRLHRRTAIDIARCIKRELPDWTVVALDRLIERDGSIGERIPFPGEHLIGMPDPSADALPE